MVAVFDDRLARKAGLQDSRTNLSIEEAGETIESRELIDPFHLYLNTSEVQLPHHRGLSSIYGWSRGLLWVRHRSVRGATPGKQYTA